MPRRRWSELEGRVLAAEVDGLDGLVVAPTLPSRPSAPGEQVLADPALRRADPELSRRSTSRRRTGHPHPPGEDLFRGSVIIDDRNAGLWKRTVAGRRVQVELDLATSCSDGRSAGRPGAPPNGLAHFLGRELLWSDTTMTTTACAHRAGQRRERGVRLAAASGPAHGPSGSRWARRCGNRCRASRWASGRRRPTAPIRSP